MIEVGQIRERDNFRFAITKIYGTLFGDRAFIIFTDGDEESVEVEFLFYNSKLIAEYPTWQEAVNSKEFRDE